MNADKVRNLPLGNKVKQRFLNFLEELHGGQEDNLLQVAIYGGLVFKKYIEHMSDINLFILVEDPLHLLDSIASFNRYADLNIQPLVYTKEDLNRAAELFPTRLQSKQRNHITLLGEDVLSTIVIDEQDIRRRARQELQNVSLRLRHDYIYFHFDHAQLQLRLRRYEPAIKSQLYSLLELSDHQTPVTDRGSDVFRSSSEIFGVPMQPLSDLFLLKQGKEMTIEEIRELCRSVLEVLQSLIRAVEDL